MTDSEFTRAQREMKVTEFGEQPSNFIQWKGTDVCIDLICSCGQQVHYDGYFLYAWKCAACKRIWEMAAAVGMRENPDYDGSVQVLADEQYDEDDDQDEDE